MGNNASGFKNEHEIVKCLNNKKFDELNDNLKNFICFLYKDISKEDIIKCYPGKTGQKPDVVIEVNGNIKKVSIKKRNRKFCTSRTDRCFCRFYGVYWY